MTGGARRSWRRRLRPWALAAAVAAVLYGAVAGVVAVRARARLEAGRTLRREGRPLAAVYVLGGAARMRTPLSRAFRDAQDELEQIAHDPAVPPDLRRIAHLEVRRAIAGRRVFDLDDPEAFAHASEAAGVPAGAPVEPREGAGTFSPVRATSAGLLFAAWVWASLRFLRDGLDEDLRLRPAAVRWGVVWWITLVGWTVLTRYAAG